MASKVVGRLYGDALEEYREHSARYEALRLNPAAFSQAESIAIVRAYWAALGRIVVDFGIAPEAEWSVSPATGAIEVEV